MGCCCSLFKKKNKKQVDETTPLLFNDYNEEADHKSDSYDIYERFVNDIITVESYEMSPKEYEERSKLYEKKVSQLNFQVPQPRLLLNDIANPESALASAPISSDDAKMIQDFLHDAVKALENIKIEHNEDLVVLFPP